MSREGKATEIGGLDRLIKRYAHGAYVTRTQDIPEHVYRQYMREFADELATLRDRIERETVVNDIDKRAREAADAVGVTPYSDMRLFVEQAVKHALSALASVPERVEATTTWPSGCVKPNSCSRHKQCMYANCKNEGRDIRSEVEAALASTEASS